MVYNGSEHHLQVSFESGPEAEGYNSFSIVTNIYNSLKKKTRSSNTKVIAHTHINMKGGATSMIIFVIIKYYLILDIFTNPLLCVMCNHS